MDANHFYGHAESQSDDDDDDYSFDTNSNSSLSDSDNNFEDKETSSYSESDDDTEDDNILPPITLVSDVQQQSSESKGNTVWQDTVVLPRNFACSAREEKHYTVPYTSDGEILPIDVYKLLVTDEIIDLIVVETNRFYDTTVALKPVTRHSKMKAWKSATKHDIEKFTDNSLSNGSNRLFKLQPLIRLLSRNFKKFTPGEKVVTDESMVFFRGRTILRQYNPSKSHKYGLKVYKLCPVDGHTWEFMVYKVSQLMEYKPFGSGQCDFMAALQSANNNALYNE
ncbi:piggyBac transposable element-derived protein 4-like [Macrobrachium rosenbergii]|uniref:piggyBac transposable element-derived protein 4-like n=1 Tax=Macrobrachium rosenbergii TaxID=79674 RepID=UPI0034D3C5D4